MSKNTGCLKPLQRQAFHLFLSQGRQAHHRGRLEGERGRLTQFGRALNQLGINHIKARSPQAKGRIERLWKTLQGRLIVEMRLANICTLEDANDFLGGFINRFNQRFAVEADSEDHAFKPAPDKDALNNILCLKMPRKASGGSTISFEGTVYHW
jgi:hypothetical protein